MLRNDIIDHQDRYLSVVEDRNNAMMLEIREGQRGDFDDIEAFVSDAISEAFYKPGLTRDEIRSNKHIAQFAYPSLREATENKNRKVYIAKIDDQLAGFAVLKDLTAEIPEIDWLVVDRNFHGKGVVQGLMNKVLSLVANGKKLKLEVIQYNERAKAFYRKYGFIDTGIISRKLIIPRILMVRHTLLKNSS